MIVRKYLFLLIVSLVVLFWVLPTLLDLRQADKEWLNWLPDADAELWTYVRLALELLAIVAGLLVLRQAWKQFWRALAD
jgi:ABC-type uncharacterized transport system YnjBCD permease subunit